MTRQIGPEGKFAARFGVRSLEKSHSEHTGLNQNDSTGSMKQRGKQRGKQQGYLGDTGSPIRGIIDRERQENGPGADCGICGARSLHALSIGYSFIEWICDICGERADRPLVGLP